MRLARNYGGKEIFGQGSRKRIDNEGALIRARVCVFLPFVETDQLAAWSMACAATQTLLP